MVESLVQVSSTKLIYSDSKQQRLTYTIFSAGAVAAVAAPAFIIMDLIEGQWKAAAWALGATAAGIGADLAATSALAGITLGSVAVAGPVGLFVGAVVGLLFAIIPGLFKKVNKPSTSKITEIVQFAFFGDMTHTGNEKCNDNLVSAGQTPNCTAVYGPGALAVGRVLLLRTRRVDALRD